MGGRLLLPKHLKSPNTTHQARTWGGWTCQSTLEHALKVAIYAYVRTHVRGMYSYDGYGRGDSKATTAVLIVVIRTFVCIYCYIVVLVYGDDDVKCPRYEYYCCNGTTTTAVLVLLSISCPAPHPSDIYARQPSPQLT